MAPSSHTYDAFIRSTPAEVWAAITDPAITSQYFHHAAFISDLVPGSPYHYRCANGDVSVDGVVEEVDLGRRLVLTWQVRYRPALAEEPPGRVEWLVDPVDEVGEITRLTLRHFDLGFSPLSSDHAALSWVGVIDSMKTLLETGEPLGDFLIDRVPSPPDEELHRRLAMKTNGETWELLVSDQLKETTAEAPELFHRLLDRAHASAYHWERATEDGAVERARAAWMLSRCYAVAGQAELAMQYADRCVSLTEAAPEAADFDVAYTHEALARAAALAGDLERARVERAAAAGVAIAGAEDKKIFDADLAVGPWFGLDR